MKKLFALLSIFTLSFTLQAQESAEETSEPKNRLNIGWAYYGRGNGISVVADREFFGILTQGVGFEEYLVDEELESSFFLVTYLHLEQLFGLTSGVEIYPGVEYGSFDGVFEFHPYLGFSVPIKEKLGLYTELGTRGVFGLYFRF